MSELADKPLRLKDESYLLHCWRLLRWFGNLRLVPRWREIDARLLRRALRRFYYDGLTRTGKIVFICSLLTFLFSYRINSNLFLITAALGMSLLAWSVVLGFVYRPRVVIQRMAPVSGVAGQVFESRVNVRNESLRSLNNFIVRELVIPDGHWPSEWARRHHPILESQQSVTIPVSFVPKKRGRYELCGIAVQSYFPFFLTRFTQRQLASSEIFILPPALQLTVPSLRQVAEQASKRMKLGTDNSKKGPSLEYSHSRQYEIGDSLRRLDHRAGSRLGKPMSKIFEGADEIRRDKVYLMIDLSLQPFLRWQRRPVDASPLDKRLALAVEVGLSAQNEGFTLTALATGNQWHELREPTEFDQHIATCSPEKTPEQAVEQDAKNLSGNLSSNLSCNLPDQILNEDGLHILVLGRWSEEARSLVDRWQKLGVLVLVFMLPESEADRGTLPVGSQFIEIQSPALHAPKTGLASLRKRKSLANSAQGGVQ